MFGLAIKEKGMPLLKKLYYTVAVLSCGLLFAQLFLNPLRIELVIVASLFTTSLAIQAWPRTIRDEMEGIGDFCMFLVSVLLIMLVCVTWWTAENEFVVRMWLSLKALMFE